MISPRPNSIAYTATGLTKAATLDGRKYDIAVPRIAMGNVLTELAARMKRLPQADGTIAMLPLMDAEIVGQPVLYMANLPLEPNVLFHTVMPAKTPS
ncbi:hypothetical protein KIP88_39300 [Bradyrhizobium sp. SRL28]|uniref:hypothetical protein n=1 Tax=Bradyrhizobium sp. SRL28 TaxID=2836178 RepID=UPI001BDDCD24|nr:hypothetical protein [Bradyrhizobium sp. SRL28]MBT1516483.1 hypothetical protein [Bradyrhizobium sp. SRL28]